MTILPKPFRNYEKRTNSFQKTINIMQQIYNLYKRIEELNEILKTRDTEQQENI